MENACTIAIENNERQHGPFSQQTGASIGRQRNLEVYEDIGSIRKQRASQKISARDSSL